MAQTASCRSHLFSCRRADRRRHLRHRSRLPQQSSPVPPARTSPSRVAGWVLTADRFRSAGPAGRAPPALILGVSWAACWCGGSPEHTATVEPAARRLGSLSRSELPGHRCRVRTATAGLTRTERFACRLWYELAKVFQTRISFTADIS